MKSIYRIILLFFIILQVRAQDFQIEKFRGFFWINEKKFTGHSQLKINDIVRTSDKSFIVLKNKFGDQISIGPNSSIKILLLNESKKPIFEILKGRLRAQIKKDINQSDKSKFFLKTKTAAIGVRGTDFEIAFQEQNQITTNITYSGLTKQVYNELDNINWEVLESRLNSQDASVVGPGEFSNLYPGQFFPTKATKIAIQQVKTLEKNRTIDYSNTDIQNYSHETDNKVEEINYTIAPDPKEISNHKVMMHTRGNIQIPKEGGLLDLDTGFYLPANQGVGSFDLMTGNYQAPTGLVLTPLDGFKSKNNDQESVRLANFLNKKIKIDFMDEFKFHMKNNQVLNKMQVYFYNDIRYQSITTFELHKQIEQIYEEDTVQNSMGLSLAYNLIDQSRWKIIPKFLGELVLHSDQKSENVDKNDHAVLSTSIEGRYLYRLNFLNAYHFVEASASSMYRDFNDRTKFDFYNRDLGIHLGEWLSFGPSLSLLLKASYWTYQTFASNQRGEIFVFKLNPVYYLNKVQQYDLSYEFSKKNRDDSTHEVNIQDFGIRWQYEYMGISGNFYLVNQENLVSEQRWKSSIYFFKDMKNYLSGKLFYEYWDQRSQQLVLDFKKHVFGLGLMINI